MNGYPVSERHDIMWDAPSAYHRPESELMILALVLVHVPLAVLMDANIYAATAHAFVVAGFGVWAVIKGSLGGLIYTLAYIVGAGVLWRMTGVGSFPEPLPDDFGHFVAISLATVAVFRFFRKWKRPFLPLLFAACLIPSIPLTLANSSGGRPFYTLSQDLLGPLNLAVLALLFLQLTFRWESVRVMFWFLMAPITGTAVLVMRNLLTEGVTFAVNASNVEVAGYNPNQVSSILGLGALIGVIVHFGTERLGERLLSLALALFFLTMGVLTFSRGGVLNFAIAFLVAAYYLVRERRTRQRLLIIVSTIVIASVGVVGPRLVEYTEASVAVRFTNLDPAGRGTLAANELEMWKSQPIFGVGPGVGTKLRVGSVSLLPKRPHTEYTRLLAEHGFFGLAALIALFLMAINSYRRAPHIGGKAWTAIFLAWSLVQMSHASTRLLASSFVFALAMLSHRPRNGGGNEA